MGFLSQFEALHELASKATGLNDFGTTDYVEPLKLMLSNYDKYSHFSQVGEQIISAGIVGPLVGRLMAQQGFKTRPELLQTPIEKPIILVGMMRTGSTALHRLMAKDPANQWVPPWLACMPMPRPPRETWESNPGYQQMVQGFEQINQMNPKIMQAHPMSAGEADECRFVLDQTFWSPGNAAMSVIPEYAEWCLSSDARYAYEYYRKVLGLISGGSDKRWVLKNPCHLWGLDALLDVFPDACIVFTHRNLKSSMPSTGSLIYEGRSLTESDLKREQQVRDALILWARSLDKTERIRKQRDPSRFFDVCIEQIDADPAGIVESIYDHFNLPMTEQSRQWLRQDVQAAPKSGFTGQKISLADYGLTEQHVYASVGEYYERYRQFYPA